MIGEVVTSGMETVVTELTTKLTPDVFFGTIADLVPFLVVIIPVALGLYFLRKMIKGAGKAKVRI